MVKDVHTVERVNEAIDDNCLWYLGTYHNHRMHPQRSRLIKSANIIRSIRQQYEQENFSGSP